MVMIIRFRLLILISLIGISYCSVSAAASIIASTDRNNIAINESFSLIFEAQGSIDAEPDFSPLRDNLDILNTSKSSSFNMINGQTSSVTRWTLTVFPKTAGSITIPSIAFGQDISNSFTIQVTQNLQGNNTKADADIFLTAEASPKNPYVQAQVIYTVKLHIAVGVSSANLSEPTLPQSDALIEKLGEDQNYEIQFQNRRYQVYERRYVIFPQKSGTLTIDPVLFSGQIQTRRSIYDPFASAGNIVRHISDKVVLQVRAIPAEFTGKHWLPTTHLSATETWAQEPPVFKTGEPLTRSITIKANGMMHAQLPEIKNSDIAGFKLYPDQPFLENQAGANGMTAMRQEKIAFIPIQAGTYTLPAINIPWWNTVKDKQEIAHIAERPIQVQAGADANNTQLPPLLPSQSEVENSNQNAQAATKIIDTLDQSNPAYSSFWKTLSLIVIALWLLTLLAWYFTRKEISWSLSKKASQHKSQSISTARLAIKNAAMANDIQSAKNAMLSWAKAVWPKNSPANISEIAKRTGEPLAEELIALNSLLYSNNKPENWKGLALWAAFQQHHPEKPHQQVRHANLEPLNKI